jgi:hypothetical protein
LSETLSRDRKNVFRPVTGRSKKKTRTSRSRSRRLKPAVRFLETVRQAAGIKNTLRSFETPSPEYQIHRRDIVTLAVGSNDDAAERFDMGRVRHLGGGGARAGRDSRGTRDAPAEHGAGYAGFPALDVRVQRRGHGGLGGLPRKRPDEPHAHRGPVYRRSGDEASARERREGKRTVDGGAGAARAARRARIPRRRRAVARDLAETSRASAAARRDRRARRARSPAARRVADTCVTSEGTDLTRVRQKARGGDARGRLARARARRGAGSGAWRGRATSHRGFRGERISLWSRTYLVTSPVLMSRRSCLSTRTAAFLNTPPVAAVREERGIKGERERSANARDVRDVASTFDRARRGIVPRLAPERVAPSPTGHAMPRAA